MDEQWQNIVGFEGRYQVSNMGRVRSLDYRRTGKAHLLSPSRGRYGHMQVCLGSEKKTMPVHRLVAMAFVDGYRPDYVVNHKDENPANNRWDNLEWISLGDNSRYGSANDKRRLLWTKRRVMQIDTDGVVIATFDCAKSASIATGIHRSCISECCNGRQNTAGGYRWQFDPSQVRRKSVELRKKSRAKVRNLDGEQWKPVADYEGLYEVSNMGRMKSLCGGGERLMTLSANKYGYQNVSLYREKKMKRFRVHRLVAMAFVEGYEKDLVVNHKDENKTNNRADNLEWCTDGYNIRYGTAKDRCGEKMGKPVVQMTTDGDFMAEYRSIAMAAKETGASSSGINHCCNHLHNRVVSGGYRWMFKSEYEQRKADGSITPLCSRNVAPVIVYAPDGHMVGEFPSMADAERSLGFTHHVICNAVHYHHKYKGYSFERKFEAGKRYK